MRCSSESLNLHKFKTLLTLKRFFKITAQIILSLIGLVLLVWLLIQTEPVQNWIVKKVTIRLSKDLNTEVKIRHVDFELFNRMNLEGTLVKDRNKDTLLYADQLKVRLTDWFFLKDDIVLKFVGLEDAQIHLTRTDSVWNYQFLVDYFSAPKSNKPKQAKSNLKLNLQKVDLKNIAIVQNDLWVGRRMEIKLTSLQLDAEDFDINENRIQIRELDLVNPYFAIDDFPGVKPKKVKSKLPVADTGMYFNDANLHLTVGKVNIKNGTFSNQKFTERAPYTHFDGMHLRFTKINGTLNNISFIKDTIKAKVDIAGKERSGFDLRKLQTDFKLTPQKMEFANLDLITPESHLRNYYAMNYEDFNTDFGDFIHKVTMDVRFTDSQVDSDDLAYFAPAAKTWKRRITLAGVAQGKVDAFNIENLFVRAGNTTINGDLTMIGLPDINATRINFTSGNLKTTYNDLATFVPAITKVTTPSIASLGNILFKGDFNGTISKFVTAGTFSTNLGGFTANVAMSLPDRGVPTYSGRIVTNQFNIGKFLVSPQLGKATFDGTINGQGLSLNTLKTTLTGHIQQIEFKDYNYQNILVEGTFQRKQFDGSLKIDDENLNLTTAVKIDLQGAQPRFNVLGDLVNSNFQNLKFSRKRLELSGLFDLNFSGKNIDQFLGSVKVYNASFRADSTRLNFDSLSLQSNYAEGHRSLTITSNEFDVAVEGVYNILDLPTSFQLYLHKYYPAYINEPKSSPKDQSFSFAINTRNIEGYTQLLDPRLKGFSNSTISGNINTIDTVFALKANVPEFSYNQYKLFNTTFDGKGNLDNLVLNGEIDLIAVNDSAVFPNTKINIVSQKDVSQVSIKTKATNTLNELNLNADLHTLPDGVKIQFRPSDFVINDKRWVLENEGEVVIRKNFVSADKVRFTQGDQEIALETNFDEEFNKSNLVVRLRRINIGDFAPFVTTNPRLEGLLGGEIQLKDFYGKFEVEANLRAEQFRLDNDSVGIVNITGGYNSTNGNITFNVTSPNELYNLIADGTYNTKDSLGSPMAVNIKLARTKIDIVNRFLGTVFADITGFATGNISLVGNPKRPELLGRVGISDGALTVKFTQVRYSIDTAFFVFDDGMMDFGSFQIKDKFGNVGNVTGKLYQKNFKNLRYDFDITSQRMLMIDTKANDNPNFYGTAIGRATVSLSGPQEEMKMYIAAEPTDSSHIYIPTNPTKESGEADFIVFKQYGTEMVDESATDGTNLIVDLDLTANPLAQIDVILDAATGDIIKAKGNGRLRIHAGTKEALTINGRYEIQSGSYDFNFQSFIRKPFILKEDAGSYIEWNGDPFDANINIEAMYIAENVRLGDLVANQGLSGAVQGYNGDVYVYATLTDKLQKPTIKFRLDFPTGSSVKNEDSFVKLLAALERDNNEMLKQVTYLIVFGSFAPYGEGRDIGSNITTLGFNTLSEMIAKQVNSLVSNLLFKITGDRSLQFDVSTSLYNSSSLFTGNVTATNNIDRQQVNFKLGKSLFDNKVLITFGGDLDFRMGSSSAGSQQLGNLQWLPDLTVEIILSKNRQLRAIIFSRNNLDITQGAVGRRNRQGVSISYRRDFDKLFGSKPKDVEVAKEDSSVVFKK